MRSSSEQNPNARFHQSLAGYPIEDRQSQEDNQCKPRRIYPADHSPRRVERHSEHRTMPLLWEKGRIDMILQEVRVDAEDMEQEKPRQAHDAADGGIERNCDRGVEWVGVLERRG